MEEKKTKKLGRKRGSSFNQNLSINPDESSVKPKPKTMFNKKLVYIICGIITTLSVVLIIWSVIKASNQHIDEETTFATNDTQTTITVESNDDGTSDKYTRTVYKFDDNGNVTSMKTYFEYTNNEAAMVAYEVIKDQPEFKGAEVVDKYIVVTADSDAIKGLTAEIIRQQSENIKRYYETNKNTQK